MGKRKRTQMKHYATLPQTVYTKFGLKEVDKIMESWASRNLFNRRTDIFSKCAIFENNNNVVDHISILPDDVLQYIISMLTMREGARTSILSSRWRNLWRSSVSYLNFDAVNMIGRCNYFLKIINDRRRFLDTKRRRFIKWVDQILHLRQGARIDALRICYFLGKKSSSDIDRWVDLAAAQGVHKLIIDLDLTKFGLILDLGKLYKFPFRFFARGNGSTLIHLKLASCVFKLPRHFEAFNSLLSLHLEKTCLTGKDVRNILSNCSSLEWLSIRLCEFLRTPSLKFAAPSLCLKHLAILNCSNFLEIEVEATKLISFEYEGQAVKASFKNVSRVVSSYLGFSYGVNLKGVSYVLNELPSNLPWLETLFLCRQPDKENILPAKLPTFTNLKRLVFSVMTESRKNLLELTSLLEACPSLQKLELDLYVSCNSEDVQTKVSRNSGSFHSNLKEIEIYGFRGYHNEIELAKCLLKYAYALEKMEVYTNIVWFYCGNGQWALHRKIERPAGIPLEEVRKLLQKEARSTTRVIIAPSHL